jgi:capsule biosynthesis phosphatase
MFEWVVDTLPTENFKDFGIAGPNDFIGNDIRIAIQSKLRCPWKNFAPIDYKTRGPIESARIFINNLNDDDKFFIIDNDILYDNTINWNPDLKENDIGVLVQRYDVDGERSPYCHVKIDDNGFVKNMQEKKNIGEHIVLGGYVFGSKKIFEKLFSIFEKSSLSEGEWFMSHLFKIAIETNISVIPIYSHTSVSIGTPDEMDCVLFENRFNVPKLRWVFDLDNTLVTKPEISGKYESVRPNRKVISFVQKLFNTGHHIIINTARGMLSCNEDINTITKNVKPCIELTLKKYDIPYHELILGKPYGDVYIDDKAVNSNDWFGSQECITRSVGYGWDKMVMLDDITDCVTKRNNVCTKKCHYDEYTGYKYYVNNCPEWMKQYTPRIINFDDQLLEIEMEWVDGINVGDMICSGNVTGDVINQIIIFMDRLHNHPCENTLSEINFGHEYLQKLVKRVEMHHDIYKYMNINFNEIETFLREHRPRISLIHGDYWCSNMIWNHATKKLSVLDMRGKIGDILSCCGDSYYDYAKFYQSVLGFDAIVKRKTFIDPLSKNKMLAIIHRYFNDLGIDIDRVQKLACILMVSSLPFHNFDRIAIDMLSTIINDIWPAMINNSTLSQQIKSVFPKAVPVLKYCLDDIIKINTTSSETVIFFEDIDIGTTTTCVKNIHTALFTENSVNDNDDVIKWRYLLRNAKE